jgi:hypothetical protein
VARVAEPITIRGIWGGMSDELAATILGEVRQENRDLYREALANTAAALRMRPQVLQQQPAARQAATIRRVLTQVTQTELGAHLLIEWLTRCQKPMLTQFLDSLGVAHEEGTIKEELGPEPERDRLTAAITSLRESFPPDHVTVYLSAFALITADEWGSLPELISPEREPAP